MPQTRWQCLNFPGTGQSGADAAAICKAAPVLAATCKASLDFASPLAT
jgi:hypothetical protein